jgi:hypothetical protein
MDTGNPERRKNSKPVQIAGQHAIKNNGIIAACSGFKQTCTAIDGYFNGTTIVNKGSFDLGSCSSVVLDYKNYRHVTSLKTPN